MAYIDEIIRTLAEPSPSMSAHQTEFKLIGDRLGLWRRLCGAATTATAPFLTTVVVEAG